MIVSGEYAQGESPWVKRVLEALRRRRQLFLVSLDDEKVSGYQRFYYSIIILAGLYLWLVASDPARVTLENLGPFVYEGWILLNIVCPTMTLVGRSLYIRSASYSEGESNPSYGAAQLQFWGDLGVLSAITIYALCVLNTPMWGQPLYTTFFFSMGIPGSFLFTLRSWRRVREIHRVEKGLT